MPEVYDFTGEKEATADLSFLDTGPRYIPRAGVQNEVSGRHCEFLTLERAFTSKKIKFCCKTEALNIIRSDLSINAGSKIYSSYWFE